ncbi:hypothetical protein [Corynebacterium sp.]|uniref:hypothetical protein n=1 Tax=Corynebacterium sp. TaxID=1720 RepID=UPI003B3B349D
MADVTPGSYVRVRRAGPGQWHVVSKWGTSSWTTWPEAMADADHLRRTIRDGLAHRAERIRTADGPCAYQGCGEPGHHINGWGRGFAFCDEHAPVAEHAIANPRPIRNRRAPQIHSLKEHAA